MIIYSRKELAYCKEKEIYTMRGERALGQSYTYIDLPLWTPPLCMYPANGELILTVLFNCLKFMGFHSQQGGPGLPWTVPAIHNN